MIYNLKKLTKGHYAEIRDYDVKKCIDSKTDIVIIFNDKKMTLTPQDLVDKKIYTSPLFKSKMDKGKDYKLYSYKWNPEE